MRIKYAVGLVSLALGAGWIGHPAAADMVSRSAGEWSLFCHDTDQGRGCSITASGKTGDVLAGGQLFKVQVDLVKPPAGEPSANLCIVASGGVTAASIPASATRVRTSETHHPGAVCFDGDRFHPAIEAIYAAPYAVRFSLLGQDGNYVDAEVKTSGFSTLADDAIEILGIGQKR